MFIRKITITNFRPFSSTFTIDNLNVPNTIDKGSGLNVFVGENGCGKTTLMDALVLPILEYKAESVSLDDFFDINHSIDIKIFSDQVFTYNGTMPHTSYKGKGFEFEAKLRSRSSATYLSSVVVSDQRFIRADGETKPEDGKPESKTQSRQSLERSKVYG